MKRGNVEIIESDGGYRILSKRDYPGRAFWISEKDLKDLHSLLSELLETPTVKEKHTALCNYWCQETPCNRKHFCDCGFLFPTQPSNSEKEECNAGTCEHLPFQHEPSKEPEKKCICEISLDWTEVKHDCPIHKGDIYHEDFQKKGRHQGESKKSIKHSCGEV